MGAFAVGRGLPLLAVGASAGALSTAGRIRRYVPMIERAVGILLLAGASYFVVEFARVAPVSWRLWW